MGTSQWNTLYSYVKQTKMSFFWKNGEQEGKTGTMCGVIPVGGAGYKERVWEGEYGTNIVYTCMNLEKWDLLELFQEQDVGDKEEWLWGEFKYDILSELL
jgi:hypothetical protein